MNCPHCGELIREPEPPPQELLDLKLTPGTSYYKVFAYLYKHKFISFERVRDLCVTDIDVEDLHAIANVMMYRLRKKVEHAYRIRTIRGAGYTLEKLNGTLQDDNRVRVQDDRLQSASTCQNGGVAD